jgi:hypothetical protein
VIWEEFAELLDVVLRPHSFDKLLSCHFAPPFMAPDAIVKQRSARMIIRASPTPANNFLVPGQKKYVAPEVGTLVTPFALRGAGPAGSYFRVAFGVVDRA